MPTSVSDLIEEAFDRVLRQNQKLYESWIEIATQLGGRVLPFSLLGPEVHDIGALDLVLRCMENETKAVIDSARENGTRVELPMAHRYQSMLSHIWVSEIYEVFRLLKKRKLLQENDIFYELENHLRLLRVPFDKHELAKDWKLKEHPNPVIEQALIRETSVLSIFSDPSGYDLNNPKRAYSLNSRNSARGSIEWKALDLDTGEAVWLERLSLSERVLDLFQNHKLVLNNR